MFLFFSMEFSVHQGVGPGLRLKIVWKVSIPVHLYGPLDSDTWMGFDS